MGTRGPRESDPMTPYEKQSELKRILESKYFAKAPKRKRFLEFTSAQAFLGEGDKLNEYLIGVEVYGRGVDFDPHQDPIVRVQAHEIRRALKSYYENEGKDCLLRVDFPPGHYVPVFSRAKLNSGDAATAAAPEERLATEIRRGTWRWQLALILCLSLACVTLGLLLLRERSLLRQRKESRPVAAALPESEEWFWKPFLSSGSQPLVVVTTGPVLSLTTAEGNSPQTPQVGFTIPKSKLPAFHDTPHFRSLKSYTFVTSIDYTGVGEAISILGLSRLFVSQGKMIRVKASRLVDYTEIQGGNTIMLGGSQWTDRVLFNPQWFSIQEGEGAIRNNNPLPGEQSIYAPKFDPVTNSMVRDYALILMEPNHMKEGRLLSLNGLYTQGTEAAAEYVTNPQSLNELRKALLAASPDKKTLPSFFEALLSVPVENNVPGEASLLAVRIIPQ